MNEVLTDHYPKLNGFKFWEATLNKAQYVVAPMVDQSELAWRMLSRKYGAELCYTPMFHASVFNRSSQYKKDALVSCQGDRPLIVQFCGNDPDAVLEAALVAQDHCDAVDLNLGCPQSIARKGYYGAFLSENWKLIEKIVQTCHEKLSVPITCKIRIFTSIQKTVDYAKMLESAGCQLLTVHGRTKEMKGPLTGLASWEHIKAVKDAVKIPVFANGNIQYKADVIRCMKETGVDGVMIAEGNLHNPALFLDKTLIVWDISLEYLDFAEKYPPCPNSYARGHVFKLCHHALQRHVEARKMLSDASSLGKMRQAVEKLRDLCQAHCWREVGLESDSGLPFRHWICQPYVRPTPAKPAAIPPRKEGSDEVVTISKKKMKKLFKRGVKLDDLSTLDSSEKAAKIANLLSVKAEKTTYRICVQCGNPGGFKCVFTRCKPCCKKRMKDSKLSCTFHRNTKRIAKENANTTDPFDENVVSFESNSTSIS